MTPPRSRPRDEDPSDEHDEDPFDPYQQPIADPYVAWCDGPGPATEDDND